MADILSQDELDALLMQMDGPDDDDDDAEIAPEPAPSRRPPAPVAAAPVSPAPQSAPSALNVELILNIPVEVQVELGRTTMTIHQLLQLGQGSVIELNRGATDLIDLTVNGRVVAQGEAVVIHESFGFRAVEVESVRDRIRNL